MQSVNATRTLKVVSAVDSIGIGCRKLQPLVEKRALGTPCWHIIRSGTSAIAVFNIVATDAVGPLLPAAALDNKDRCGCQQGSHQEACYDCSYITTYGITTW